MYTLFAGLINEWFRFGKIRREIFVCIKFWIKVKRKAMEIIASINDVAN